jgi:hypothetical protein
MSDFNLADWPDFAPGEIRTFRKKSSSSDAEPEWEQFDSFTGFDPDADPEDIGPNFREVFDRASVPDPATAPPARFLCRHIFTDGRRCRAACLKGEQFCYYHHTSRKPVAAPRDRQRRRSTFTLPVIDDRSSIQAAINEILQRIATNQIDPRRAGLALYAIQTAAVNLPRQPLPSPGEKTREPDLVEEVEVHPTFGNLAPQQEISDPDAGSGPSLAQQLCHRAMKLRFVSLRMTPF